MVIAKWLNKFFTRRLGRKAPRLGAGLLIAGLALLANTAMATDVILDGTNVTRIQGLEVFDDQGGVTVYDVEFVYGAGVDVYGSQFDFNQEEEAFSALAAVQQALNGNSPRPSGAGPRGTRLFYIGAEYDSGVIAAVGAEYINGLWDDCETGCAAGTALLAVSTPFTYAKFRPTDGSPSPDNNFVISLEEPINAATMGGIGNLRGWAVSDDGIDRVEMWLNGSFLFDVPYGGERNDVAAAFPDTQGSLNSGFSAAFGYSNLGVGTYTMTARAYNTKGEVKESSATFTVVTLAKVFIPATDEVSTEGASASFNNDEVRLNGVSIDGLLYDLRLKWRTAEQGFEIIEAHF